MFLNHAALLFLLPAFAVAHSNHHTHHGDDEAFSVEVLEALERKWGTDVYILERHLLSVLTLSVGILRDIDLRTSPPHSMFDPTRN
jgi:hypothetical protein